MISKISGVNNADRSQAPVKKKKPQAQEQASIFEKDQAKAEKANHGKGLGVGQIPPGLQKKIEDGTVPQSLVDKFKQIMEALKPKEEAAAEPVPVEIKA